MAGQLCSEKVTFYDQGFSEAFGQWLSTPAVHINTPSLQAAFPPFMLVRVKGKQSFQRRQRTLIRHSFENIDINLELYANVQVADFYEFV